MKFKNIIAVLVALICLAAAFAATRGITSSGGPGRYEYESVRGQAVTIYGTGIYRHMSADVAVQGIAQDYVTLGAILLLLGALLWARRGSLRGLLLLSGTLGYFLVTYLFYLAMAMFNELFLAYVLLLGASFFAFILTLFSYDPGKLKEAFVPGKLPRYAGIFLIVNAGLIALLWLSIVVPPLLSGAVYPREVEHYTTLIVQGFDLALLLPLAVIAGYLALRGLVFGRVAVTVYLVFLALLMTALSSKLGFMAATGVNVIPAVFIIPVLNVLSITFAVLLLRSARTR